MVTHRPIIYETFTLGTPTEMFRFPKISNSSPSKRVSVAGPHQKNLGLCKYPHRKCSLLCLENYDYCLKHILEDKSAPYKPCPFLYTVSGKKCGKPAFRPERKDTWFCAEHTRKNNLLRQKASSKRAPPPTQEALLASLGHYARTDQTSLKHEENEHEESTSKQSSQAINPFDAAAVNAQSSQVLDYASDSDSDVEGAMLDNVWRALDNESSDAESIDSQAEDPLKHAGVYTAEEVTVVIKDKMIRLQSLYIDQFRRLHHLLKERRRKYLHALKKEKETLCSIHDQEKTTAKEQKLYQKLKALNHFHKYYGAEAVLHKKALERRALVTEGTIPRTSHKGKCAFTEGGVKCGAKTLPVTKYCRKHILEDTQQVLFRACGFKRDDHICQEPTLNVFENATCVYHITLPTQPHNSLDMNKVKEGIKEEHSKETNEGAVVSDMEISDTSKKMIEENEIKPLGSTDSFSKPDNVMDSTVKLEEPVDNTKDPTEPAVPTESIVQNNGGNTSESTCAVQQTEVEKMDVDNSAASEEVIKQDNSAPIDELVMVDMMTDVGVVEEVLESEEKTEVDESMQIPGDKNSTDV
ncbi:KAT8 regulatory NSL complex subunit 2 isoform X2 [Homalodisca vitripennis]|uniref:KAT8 regulatory NSL complex subunit 2 isoform X2 n=1 Tax=Homalodisca vitripennis TaxID=197043 RepID=UPI001EEB3758|nr:KAT8 regulatory NSL complex subunit 2 isoform X2 [Homalodisca vitripennis]